MKPKRVIPLFVTAACALGAVPAASAATDVQQATSGNWSGYVVGSSSGAQNFSSVSGSWVQPTANCSASASATGSASGSGSYGAFWIGLGGSGQSQAAADGSQSEALEQDGTEADCGPDGSATYFAWYELVPAAPVRLDLAVHPGDRISSKISVAGQQVTMELSDQTTGQSVSKSLQMADPDTSSAEWIAEAPSQCGDQASDCTPLPLTDFGTVQFSNATATTTDGHTGTISDPQWSAAAVALSPADSGDGVGAQFASTTSDSSAGANPSSLSSDGSSFSVAWSDDSSSTGTSPTSTGSGSGDGSGGRSGYPYGDGGGYPYGYGGGGYGGYGGGGAGGGWAIVIPGVGVIGGD